MENCDREDDDLVEEDYEGECDQDCDYNCGEVWDPVCATNGVTYENEEWSFKFLAVRLKGQTHDL